MHLLGGVGRRRFRRDGPTGKTHGENGSKDDGHAHGPESLPRGGGYVRLITSHGFRRPTPRRRRTVTKMRVGSDAFMVNSSFIASFSRDNMEPLSRIAGSESPSPVACSWRLWA